MSDDARGAGDDARPEGDDDTTARTAKRLSRRQVLVGGGAAAAGEHLAPGEPLRGPCRGVVVAFGAGVVARAPRIVAHVLPRFRRLPSGRSCGFSASVP